MKLRGLDPTVAAAVVAWIAQPFVLGPLIADALDPTSDAFRRTVTIGAWTWWFAVLVALAVPRPLTLTVARIGAAAAVPASVWAAFEVDVGTGAAVGLVGAGVAATLPLLPAVGERGVDGASYGDERRFLLRPPGPVLVALVVPTWAVTVAGLVAGPLLLAVERWVLGAALAVVGLPVAFVGGLALHRLTRRFLVLVPNGLVVHDATTLREPVLFERWEIAGVGPAGAHATGLDLTGQALGLALELRLTRPATVPVVTGRTTTEDRTTGSILLAPTRPAAVLHLAADRGLPIA